MGWEEEKESYARKLRQIIRGIDEIENLEGNRLVTPEMGSKLRKSAGTANDLLPKLAGEEFEIAVVGLEKAGKSSFSNALTGLAVLPTDDQRCTYTSTCIRPGETNRATVKFYSKAEFDRSFAEKLQALEIPDAEKYSLRNLTLSKYSQLYDSCSDSIKRSYEDNLNLDIRDTIENWQELQKYVGHEPIEFHGDELESEEFASFIKNPARAIAVKDVTIYSTELKDMPNAVLYDVPGFDSPTAMHRAQTLQKMRAADAIIMVASAKAPSINSPALSIFRENVDDYGCKLDEKLFIFANKADMVDTAEKLRENMEITYKEWIEKRRILSPQFRNRITFGSANAHLGDKVERGLDCRATLQRYGYEPGIDEFREKLKSYYQNERFDVLKKRVISLLKEVNDVFADVDRDVSDTPGLDYKASSKLAVKTYCELRDILTKQLENIKYELNQESNNLQPLKTAISDQISQRISLDEYRLTDEEIEEVKKSLYVTSMAAMPSAVNTKVRERRFHDMQQSFTKDILGCAVTRHGKISEQILDAFMEAMNVAKNRPEYEKFRQDIAVYCGLDKAEDELYYRSLIERFGRDLFEVQILTAHGPDRKDKFIREAANFLSLGVFYGQDRDGEEGPLPQNPLHSRLWRLILYPEIVREDSSASTVDSSQIMETVRKFANVKQLGYALENLVLQIIKKRGSQAGPAIEEALRKITPGGTSRMVLQKVTEALQTLAAGDGSVTLEEILTTSRYLDDRHERELDYSYEQVKEDFSDDILALREGLLKAFVPAVDLDKAFNAKESTYIEKILDELKDEKFQDFVSDNLAIIKRDELEEINGDLAQKELDRAVMQQIKSILSSISAPVS